MRSGCCTAPRPASSSVIRPGSTPSGTARSRTDEAYTLTQHKEQLPLLPPADTDGMSEKEIKSEQRRRAATRFFFIDTLRKPTRAELEEAAHHHDGDGHEIEGDGNGHHAITSGEADHLAK